MRDRDVVELVERVRDAEPRLDAGEELGIGARRELGVRAASARHDDPCRRGTRADFAQIDELPRSHGERDQVRRQRPRLREADRREPVGAVALRFDARIRQRDEAARHAQRQLPRRLEAGLVEAREGAARRERLELRHRVPRAAVLQRKDAARRVLALLAPRTRASRDACRPAAAGRTRSRRTARDRRAPSRAFRAARPRRASPSACRH